MTTAVTLVNGVSGIPLAGTGAAAPINSPAFTGVPTTPTAGPTDNTTQIASDAFVNQQINRSTATLPFALGATAGGIYNQNSLGSGLTIVVFVSSSPGPVSSILSVVNGGTNYAVGDLIILPGGNYDAILRVTNVIGGVVQTGGLQVLYGGTNYTTGFQTTAIDIPPAGRTVILSGTLTSNATIIITNGTFANASRRSIYANNTTGAFTVTVKLSNGAGGSTGTGVVLPQGSNNSTAKWVFTDGVNDVWFTT